MRGVVMQNKVNMKIMLQDKSIYSIYNALSWDGIGTLDCSALQDQMDFQSMISYDHLKRWQENKYQWGHSPVRIVLNASSTFDESNADVSKKDKPYFSVKDTCTEQYVICLAWIIIKVQVLNVPRCIFLRLYCTGINAALIQRLIFLFLMCSLQGSPQECSHFSSSLLDIAQWFAL